jgi:AraC-like DNA-binding protein
MPIAMSARIGALILQSAAASGADPAALEAETGFIAATALDPDARMSLTTETALWAAGERLSGDRDLGLHTAERLQPGVFDVLDYVVRTAPTLRIAVQRLGRYNRLEHDVAEFRLEDDGERVRILHAFRGGRPGQTLGQHRHSIEFTLASLAIIGRQLSGGPFAPTAVSFCHAAPEDTAAHADVFGVLPRFSAVENLFEVAAADLDRPLPAADARLWRVIERHAEALLAARPDPAESLAARVAREVTNALGEGPPSLAEVARRLHMSERSLQRHLRDEGVRFEALVEGLRRDLAMSYLSDRKMAIAEVAYLLGYSEPSAFHRAFKRWTGTTPGELRA